MAVGSGALASNTSGQQNTAIGTQALTNSNANFNVAIGFRAGFMNTTGNHLAGIGGAALRNNTTGTNNTAIGTTGSSPFCSGKLGSFSSPLLLEYAATVLVCFHLFVVLYEEPSLELRFGESYLSYCKAVPRWGLTIHPFSSR